MKFKNEKKTKIFGNERFTFEKCCTGNHDLKTTEQRLRNDGYIVRTEFINGKHNIYKKEKTLHKNYWGTTSQFWNRNPLLPKQVGALRALTYDSDKDGKRDWEDCRPLDPKRQDIEGEFKTPEGNVAFRTRVLPRNKQKLLTPAYTEFSDDGDKHFPENQFLHGEKVTCPYCGKQNTYQMYKANPNLFSCSNCLKEFILDKNR